MFHVVKPLTGGVYLEVDTEFAFVVHPAAVLGDLDPILQARLSAEAIAALGTQVLNLRGEMVVWSVIPAEIKAESKTKAWMIEDERLNEPGGMMRP